jgi:hypothetical protein
MPWAFAAILTIYGLCAIVFAFREPPEALRSLFKVPAIFVFLPDRLVMPAGRLFVGASSLAVVGYLFTVLHR